MDVGKEEEVWAVSLGDMHGTRDGANAWADGGKKADLEGVDGLVEVLDLVFLGGLVIPLLGDGGVRLGIDLGLFEWFRHVDGGLIDVRVWM